MRAFLPIALVALALSGCSSAIEIPSSHAARPPALDGTRTGWEGKMYDLRDERVYVGVQEDTESVYLCVESADRSLAAMLLRRGLKVTIAPDGESGRQFGLQYPIGSDSPEGEWREGGPSPPVVSDVEFYGPEGEILFRAPLRMVERDYGVTVHLVPAGPSTIFQLKIPRTIQSGGIGIGPLEKRELMVTLALPPVRTGTRLAPPGVEGEGPGEGGGMMGEGGQRGGGLGGPPGGRPGGMEGGGDRSGGSRSSPSTESVTLRVKMGSR